MKIKECIKVNQDKKICYFESLFFIDEGSKEILINRILSMPTLKNGFHFFSYFNTEKESNNITRIETHIRIECPEMNAAHELVAFLLENIMYY